MSGEPEASEAEQGPNERSESQPDTQAEAEVRAEGVAEAPDPEAVEAQLATAPLPEAEPTAKDAEKAPARKRRKGDPPEPIAGAYHVELPAFEGPLDLLLHLIQQHELDIKDIPILFVSQKYVEYIMMMQELNIDLASEYLVMAATLAHIKSKMLLPKPPVDQDDENAEESDPRAELVRRLLEYQKYKNAAEQLGGAPVLGRDVFLRGAPAPMVDGPSELAQVSVFKLFDAFQKLLSRAKEHADHLIDVDRISISERILELTDLLRGKGRVAFVDLFDENMVRADLIVSFLAVLEMTRLRMMIVIQSGPLAPIEIELTLASEHDDILHIASAEAQGDPLAELALAAQKQADEQSLGPAPSAEVETEPSPDTDSDPASSADTVSDAPDSD